MALFLLVVSVMVIGTCVLVFNRTQNYTIMMVCLWIGGVAVVVAIISGIVLKVNNNSEDRKAITTYLEAQGYHVSDVDHHTRKQSLGGSYWTADVYRVANTQCGGTIRLTRSDDRTTITRGLSC